MTRVVWAREVSADVIKNALHKSGFVSYAKEIDEGGS